MVRVWCVYARICVFGVECVFVCVYACVRASVCVCVVYACTYGSGSSRARTPSSGGAVSQRSPWTGTTCRTSRLDVEKRENVREFLLCVK